MMRVNDARFARRTKTRDRNEIGVRAMTTHAATARTFAARPWVRRKALCLAVAVATSAIGCCPQVDAQAQGGPAPSSQTLPCPDPASQDLIQPPEIVASPTEHVLTGTINLIDQPERIPSSVNGGPVTCVPQRVRVFQGEGLPPTPPAQKPAAGYFDPIPGPTLRARVGDRVELTFVNQVNPSLFDRNLVVEECTRVGQDGKVYPGKIDKYPNCLHASSTANLHFHGTHTSPSSTADNVYLQIPPLPRDNQGILLPVNATAGFDEFFKTCLDQIRNNPVKEWPTTWDDPNMPNQWIDKQIELLTAYQQRYPTQPLLDLDQQVRHAGGWPQYYIGAFPYCFPLPAYTADVWPPPPGSNSPNMGQAPGTHWYHAHKHGSTAINVGNGMTGAFIIEGQYDDDLQGFYGRFTLKDGKPWDVHRQPVMVLNQLLTTPNRISGGGPTGLDFEVNGRLRPIVHMQPGEVQLWRIVNAAGRSAAYFMAPEGFEWRQTAQDGVQFADQNYRDSQNKPFYLAPGNRVDLLVKAPMKETTAEVRIQNVMGRGRVLPNPVVGSTDPVPGTPLMTISVSGPPVRVGPVAAEMPFINKAPTQPPFLVDIADWELRKSNYASITLDFNSKGRGSAEQHTINGIQFQDQKALVPVQLGTAQEWTIKNSTGKNPGIIDHPFHIHVNPFQITEVFDPNENLVDPQTGQLEGKLNPTTKKTEPIPKYVVLGQGSVTDPRQCVLDPEDPSTWKPCHQVKGKDLIWWDVFAIPSGRPAPTNTDPANVIPGYFKMRSRFVDYPGLYVLHCHILIHEDRGMMFGVEVGPPKPVLVTHH
jgi:FtsP/CotA-like multicopper oxidase with cupredoxin domain